MGSFKRFVEQKSTGGEDAGKLEIVKTSVDEAESFAEKKFKNENRLKENEDITKVLPNFTKNYKHAKETTGRYGKTKRRDMPVVEFHQVRQLQSRLKHGNLDVRKPLAPTTKKLDNPFPEGLSGEQAKKWLSAGLRDGTIKDDVIKVKQKMVAAKNILPVQKQIYFDKALSALAEYGIETSVKFLTGSWIIITSDSFLIDGHHRWLSTMLIDPEIKVPGIEVDWSFKKFLPLIKAYGDAIGNERNK